MCGLMLLTFKGIWHQCCRFHGTTWVWVNDGVPTVNIQKHKWDLRALVEEKIMTRILIYKCKNHMNHLNGTFIVIFSPSFPCYGINKLKFDELFSLRKYTWHQWRGQRVNEVQRSGLRFVGRMEKPDRDCGPAWRCSSPAGSNCRTAQKRFCSSPPTNNLRKSHVSWHNSIIHTCII